MTQWHTIFLNLATSKTQQICETSSIFDGGCIGKTSLNGGYNLMFPIEILLNKQYKYKYIYIYPYLLGFPANIPLQNWGCRQDDHSQCDQHLQVFRLQGFPNRTPETAVKPLLEKRRHRTNNAQPFGVQGELSELGKCRIVFKVWNQQNLENYEKWIEATKNGLETQRKFKATFGIFTCKPQMMVIVVSKPTRNMYALIC